MADLGRQVADTMPELAEALRTVLADYDAVVADWRAAIVRAGEDEAPSVRDAETYGDGLERVAHAFATVIREVVQ